MVEIVSYGLNIKGEFVKGICVILVLILFFVGGVGVGVILGLYGVYFEYFIVDEVLLLFIFDVVLLEVVVIIEFFVVGLYVVNCV